MPERPDADAESAPHADVLCQFLRGSQRRPDAPEHDGEHERVALECLKIGQIAERHRPHEKPPGMNDPARVHLSEVQGPLGRCAKARYDACRGRGARQAPPPSVVFRS